MIEKVGLEQRRRGGIKEGKVIKAAACQDQDPQILLLHFTCTEGEAFYLESRRVWKGISYCAQAMSAKVCISGMSNIFREG